jgi:prepilin-type N-terminal cleavage/methylation domain-containing protein
MRRRGFTLIETLVGVALAGTIAGASAMVATSAAAALRLAATSRNLAQAMRETRARAMAEGSALDVAFDATTQAWSIRALDGTIRHVESMPAPIRFVSLPSSARIRFESIGTASNGTVVLGGTSTAQRSIVVNQRGRVRLG